MFDPPEDNKGRHYNTFSVSSSPQTGVVEQCDSSTGIYQNKSKYQNRNISKMNQNSNVNNSIPDSYSTADLMGVKSENNSPLHTSSSPSRVNINSNSYLNSNDPFSSTSQIGGTFETALSATYSHGNTTTTTTTHQRKIPSSQQQQQQTSNLNNTSQRLNSEQGYVQFNIPNVQYSNGDNSKGMIFCC